MCLDERFNIYHDLIESASNFSRNNVERVNIVTNDRKLESLEYKKQAWKCKHGFFSFVVIQKSFESLEDTKKAWKRSRKCSVLMCLFEIVRCIVCALEFMCFA